MKFPADAGELGLWPDHVNHSVSSFEDACARMEKLGFVLTPRSDQLAPDSSGALKPTGMANRCVMLEEGYIEVSGNVGGGDHPAVVSFRELLDRYVGVHLLALGSPSPEAQVARLPEAGYGPASLSKYQRMVDTETGEELARFTLAVIPRDLLPEARLLMVRHETPAVLWQKRWIAHPNGATGLAEVIVASADIAASQDRLGRFLGVDASATGTSRTFPLARGRLTLLPETVARRHFALVPPVAGIVGYVVNVPSGDRVAALLDTGGVEPLAKGDGWISVAGGAHLGSTIVFAENGARLPWHS